MGPSRPVFNTTFNSHPLQSPFTSTWSGLTPSTSSSGSCSAAGRKRTREEAAPNLEDDYAVQLPVPQADVETEDGWEYGEGMTLVKPGKKGIAIEAGSQTGTWAEEKAEEEKTKLVAAAQLIQVADRPVLRASKSQKLHFCATPAITEEVSNATASSPGSPERAGGLIEPTIDDFTRHLGIGWSSIHSADEDIQAAARGWSKYIEKHFPITNAQIRLQSKGLASYLVEANEGFFLFGEDLQQGRLVSTVLEQTFANLKGPVPTFDGDLVMEAAASPKFETGPTLEHDANELQEIVMSGSTNNVGHSAHHSMNGLEENVSKVDQKLPTHNMEVEMDMS